jgi:hypothetical protein
MGKNSTTGFKASLSTKTCIVCNRDFQYRKKWAKVWEDVKYCSDKCRQNKSSAKKNDPVDPDAKYKLAVTRKTY